MTRSRNCELVRGVNALSHNETVKRSGRWRFRGRGGERKAAGVKKSVGKTPRFYPADDVRRPLRSNKTKQRPCKLRASITPGTVLILLSGRFRGKRVVFLKQLSSGTLLVTGPYRVNGVPLKRVNQAYVLATSHRVNLTGVAVPNIDDDYFKREKAAKSSDEEAFFAQSAQASRCSDQRKNDQAALDTQLVALLSQQERAYLGARFSLSKGQRPHEMRF
eukprot:CAMPEP_0182463678 /NCGR_PEP_ID=MMETSP1319-20130603/7835_1 /TAXON_ID=172717 /ORGANISM="Bolidomonas pacifica, Strain RCC208" /LENGTH=218 /DNA_ID=CAMNT_0024663251 /DNA_START=22 /DNA_END=678 /DNA_ORIENTATION=+